MSLARPILESSLFRCSERKLIVGILLTWAAHDWFEKCSGWCKRTARGRIVVKTEVENKQSTEIDVRYVHGLSWSKPFCVPACVSQFLGPEMIELRSDGGLIHLSYGCLSTHWGDGGTHSWMILQYCHKLLYHRLEENCVDGHVNRD